jgi:diguanylate cyclase (GGDEF)-like protein/PAS domain S-box-containing protein
MVLSFAARGWSSRAAVACGRWGRAWRLAGLCWLAGLLAALAGALAAPVEGATPARQSVTVVLDNNYPPYTLRDETGVASGYLVDEWRLWEAKTGVKVNLVALDWAQALQFMAEGKADVIDTIFQTDARERVMDFSPAYAPIPVSIYTHVGIGGIHDLKSLRGFLVGVKAGDACINQLQAAGVSNLQSYASYEAVVQAAASNQLRVFCLDEPPANYLLYKAKVEAEFNKSFSLSQGELHRAVRKGDAATLALVRQGFDAITPQERQALHDKWMGTALMSRPYSRYGVYALLAAALVGGVLVAWSLLLRRLVRQRTLEINATKQQLQATLSAVPDMLLELGISGLIHHCHSASPALLRLAADTVVGRSVFQAMPEAAAQSLMAAVLEADRGEGAQGAQIAVDQPHGEALWYELSIARREVLPGEEPRFVVMLRDISERKRAVDQIHQLAFYDPLTHLPNRLLLTEQLKKALVASERSRLQGALLFIDLDNFKALNDTMGHDMGDLLLRQVAQRLLACVREADTVARLGGDEFVVMLENLSEELEGAALQARIIGEKILLALAQPYMLAGRDHRSTPSIGVTLFAAHTQGVEDMLKQADLAMYQAKAAGRNTLRFFDTAMQAAVNTRVALETDLREAIAQGQMRLHYQPVFQGAHQLSGAEALLRWEHPQRGWIMPDDFIPLAETTGLILPLGEWVFQAACAQLAAWAHDETTAQLTMAVNVSASQFRDANFVSQVLGALAHTGANPRLLRLELTESMLAHNVADVIDKMTALKAHGIGFSLDDFGTGYSSLAYLKRLPLDQLKIDRSFVSDVLTDANDAAIARTIVMLAQSLGMTVVAEGVETEDQRRFLADNHCLAYQGYLFSRPLAIAQFNEFVHRAPRRAAVAS